MCNICSVAWCAMQRRRARVEHEHDLVWRVSTGQALGVSRQRVATIHLPNCSLRGNPVGEALQGSLSKFPIYVHPTLRAMGRAGTLILWFVGICTPRHFDWPR